MRYLDDGRLNIDQRARHQTVRVIGRKAWLFANTKSGAQASAALYSLVETAKINGLEPYDYLWLLTERQSQYPRAIATTTALLIKATPQGVVLRLLIKNRLKLCSAY